MSTPVSQSKNWLINHPQLRQWLTNQSLSAQTMIPYGLLKDVYQKYAQLAQPPRLTDLVEEKDLRRYMYQRGITEIDSHTLLPYAIVMGPSVFHQFVNNKMI